MLTALLTTLFLALAMAIFAAARPRTGPHGISDPEGDKQNARFRPLPLENKA
jgi:hypothetical protein